MNKHSIFYFLISFVLFSCDGMNDNIREYLDEGEINYIGRADSALAAGGIGRLQLSWKINSDPRIEACKIFWNNMTDSITIPIDKTQITDGRFSTILNNMKEGVYIFNLQHIGTGGYPSIMREVVGNVYGELYESSLSPRRIKEVISLENQAEIEWRPAEEQIQWVNFYYTNNKGEKITLEILNSETKTIITDYQPGGEYSYDTYYLPDENAIDSYTIESGSKKFPPFYYEFDRKDWKVIYCSSEVPGTFPVSNILDGTTSTFWHSDWDPADPLPHIITIDMQTEKNIGKVNVIRDPTRKYTRLVLLDVSLDNNNWIPIGNIRYPDQNEAGAILELTESVKGRYVRLTITESFKTPECEVSEVYVYGNE